MEEVKKELESVQTVEEQKTPKNVLLGSVAYTNYEDYEKFLNTMQLPQAVLILIAAAKFGFEHKIYSMEETELVQRSIRVIAKATTPKPQEETQPSTNDTTH